MTTPEPIDLSQIHVGMVTVEYARLDPHDAVELDIIDLFADTRLERAQGVFVLSQEGDHPAGSTTIIPLASVRRIDVDFDAQALNEVREALEAERAAALRTQGRRK